MAHSCERGLGWLTQTLLQLMLMQPLIEKRLAVEVVSLAPRIELLEAGFAEAIDRDDEEVGNQLQKVELGHCHHHLQLHRRIPLDSAPNLVLPAHCLQDRRKSHLKHHHCLFLQLYEHSWIEL